MTGSAGRQVNSRGRVVYSMRALGRRELPTTFDLRGEEFLLEKTVKHDFWAATGFYVGQGGQRVVLKMSRTEDFAGLSLLPIGRWLCRREMRFYTRLADVSNVPALLGAVGPTGFVHEYVPGRPLSKNRPVPDGFFDQLIALLHELHSRDMAYVDTNKPENILLSDDGRPHLIDFQISFARPDFRYLLFNRRVLRQLQKEDVYHILKHKLRLRPDEITSQQRAIVQRLSIWIRLHRKLTFPYFQIRRHTFRRLRESGRLLPEGSK